VKRHHTDKERKMTVTKSHGLLLAIAIELCVVAIGAGGAFALNNARTTQPVQAATHCTKYAPSIIQDNMCTVTATMAANGFWQTPFTAQRDQNVEALAASRGYSLGYSPSQCGGAPCPAAAGTGLGTAISGTGIYFRAAWCTIGGASVTGRCTTYWHD
jgi:hypothetical protein